VTAAAGVVAADEIEESVVGVRDLEVVDTCRSDRRRETGPVITPA
jgi:hypothetical protein